MSSPANFTEQYTRAKQTIKDAISQNKTIIIFGAECTGKSYLVQELQNELKKKNYSTYYYANESDLDHRIPYNTPCIVETTSMDCLKHIHRFVNNNELGVVFVNMNYYKYPAYAKTRSGKNLSA